MPAASMLGSSNMTYLQAARLAALRPWRLHAISARAGRETLPRHFATARNVCKISCSQRLQRVKRSEQDPAALVHRRPCFT